MAHDKNGSSWICLSDVADPPLEVAMLDDAACLAIILVWAAVLFIESCTTEASHVICEDGDVALSPAGMHVFVAGDMVCEAVDEDEDGLRSRGRGWIGPGVEVVAVLAFDPRLSERWGDHDDWWWRCKAEFDLGVQQDRAGHNKHVDRDARAM